MAQYFSIFLKLSQGFSIFLKVSPIVETETEMTKAPFVLVQGTTPP